MARSEFRYNRRRKHYSYLFKDHGERIMNFVLTSKPYRKEHKKIKKNTKLYRNPNPKNSNDSYLIPIVYNDSIDSFDERILKWNFHPNDKRKVKRLKKYRKV